MTPSLAYPATPGPADRVLFQDEQRRHRRASHFYTLLGVIAVFVSGVPLSLLITPVIFLVVSLVLHVAKLAGTATPGLEGFVQGTMTEIRPVVWAVADMRWPPVTAMLNAAPPLLLPGAAAMLVLWIAVRRLLAQAGAGGVLLALKARPPASEDLEERQLGNLVEEMAIAAGLPPPQLRLLDSPVANAAAVGMSPSDATLVVSRGLLDQLDRDETQGVIGHLIASVGNGDLRIAATLLSIERTMGLLLMFLSAPFGSRSRRLIVTMLRAGFARGESPKAAAVVAELLTHLGDEDNDLSRYVTRALKQGGQIRLLLYLPAVPLFFVAAAARITTIIMSGAVFGPVFAALWRRRRRLADAMAVQLTRNPDGLAGALDHLVRTEHHLAEGRGAAHLFVVWQPDPNKEVGRSFAGIATIAPSIQRRRQALRRMGATSVSAPGRRYRLEDYLSGPSLTLILVLPPLVLLSAYVAAFLILALIAFNFLLLGLLLWGLTALLDLVFSQLSQLRH